MSELLTHDDLELLTGATQAAKQAEVLRRNGIYYVERLKGITTTCHHVNHPFHIRTPSDEPNFDALDG